MQIFLVTIFSAASFLLGFFVVFRRIKNATRLFFSIYCFSIGAWVLVNYLAIINLREEVGLSLVRLVMALAIIQCVAFFLFVHTFPNSNLKLKKKWFISILTISILTIIVSISPFLFSRLEFKDGHVAPVLGPGIILFIPVAVGLLIYGMILLIIKTLRAKGILKAQLRYILFGFLLTYILILIFNFILSAFFKNSSYVQLAPYFTIPFLVSTTYAIIRYRLMDIKLVLRKGFVHAVSLVILLLLYTYLTLFFQDYFKLNRTITTLLAVLVISLTIYPLRKWLFRSIDSLFFAPEKEKETLEKFSKGDKDLNMDSLLTKAKEAITSALKVEIVRIFILDKSQEKFKIGFPIEERETNSLAEDSRILKYLNKEKDVLVREEISYLKENSEDKGDQELKELEKELNKNEAEIVVPLGEESIFGLIFLGPKKSDEAFTVHDVKFLKNFARYFTMYLGNTLLYWQTLERIGRGKGKI